MSEKNDISSALASVTKKWKAEKRKADKSDRLSSSQYRSFYYEPKTTLKESAFRHMEEAYNKASSGGRLYANARQIFYAIRPLVLGEVSGKDFDSKYFTQVLLKDYLEDYRPGWKVVWDSRGHFEEPHTGKRIGVGGIEVENYIRSWKRGEIDPTLSSLDDEIKTIGPQNRFKSVLFIEKEGFNEILRDANISQKYDLAIVSTKGMPVGALFDLLGRLESETRIFVLHDFDKSGFTILKTLREGTRMTSGIEFIDFGFRLKDIEGIEREPVSERTSHQKAWWHLEECGATEEEIHILIGGSDDGSYAHWSGQRVELNALMSEEFIEFVERKLKENGVTKFIPEDDSLAATYRMAKLGQKIDKIIEEENEKIEEYEVPEDLKEQVEEYLKDNPITSWDAAIWEIADE